MAAAKILTNELIYEPKQALAVTNNKKDTCQEILALLQAELPNFISELKENLAEIAKIRELLHGMLGAFHFTGATRIKILLPEAQKICKHSPETAETIILELIQELKALETYLKTTEINF